MLRIGYYVHHHGHGHRMRAAAVLQHVRAETTVFTSAAPTVALQSAASHLVRLPMDTDRPARAAARALPVPSSLHYAPVGGRGVPRRMARIAAWAAEAAPALLVVDVSVEVALFGRLLGLPVVAVRQHGRRTDRPHRLAYDAAAALLAPYPSWLEDDTASPAVRAKTFYAGGFSRFDGRSVLAGDRAGGPSAEGSPTVVVLGGSGGAGWAAPDLAAAARACPQWTWQVLGATNGAVASPPSNLILEGWVDDPFPWLCAADVVVAGAGHNTVMEVAAAGRPLICFPEARPFGEQAAKARALVRAGCALAPGAWPTAADWPALLRRAAASDPAPLARLCDGRGAARAAAFLGDCARRFCAPLSRPVSRSSTAASR